MSGSGQWNLRNPAVKRIVQELKEIQRDDNPDILAEALEENIFEWHFVIRGAWDSEFEGGIYHGRILMPAEYPFKPPAFVMLTPSGRFETGTKICLSISSFHPESWQPSWSVRSALVALIAFMQTPGNGAVGSMETSTEVRKQMAREARETPPKHGNADRQELIANLHARMLEMEERSKALALNEHVPESPGEEQEKEVDKEEEQVDISVPAPSSVSQPIPEPNASPTAATPPPQPSLSSSSTVTSPTPSPSLPPPLPQQQQQQQQQHHSSWEDKGLTYLAALLVALLVAVLLRRVIVAFLPTYKHDPLMFSVNPTADIDLDGEL